jgi:hypothetical protein
MYVCYALYTINIKYTDFKKMSNIIIGPIKCEPPKVLSDTPAGALPGNSRPLDLQRISYTQTEDRCLI